MENERSLRILTLARILCQETDEEHPIGTKELIQRLQERCGISTHRGTIYEEIQLLRDFGLDIISFRSTQNYYYLGTRLFDLPELKLLIDAVESSKFITAKKSRELVEKLTQLSSRNRARELRRNLFPEGRIKPENEKIYYIVDAIHSAIQAQRKISFPYFRYNARKQKELRHGGTPYVFSPWALVWNGDYYYMLGWSDRHGTVGSFRVDRIAGQPQILEEAAVPPPEGFDPGGHINGMFRMFDGPRQPLELLCENELMDTMIDRFGEELDATPVDPAHFLLRIDLAVNHLFFGWLFGFGGKVRLLSPAPVVEEYRKRLEEAGKALK